MNKSPGTVFQRVWAVNLQDRAGPRCGACPQAPARPSSSHKPTSQKARAREKHSRAPALEVEAEHAELADRQG